MQCPIRNDLTYSQQKFILTARCEIMDNSFFAKERVVTEIVVACFVPKGGGTAIHKNRPSHGLAFNCGGEKTYSFSDGPALQIGKNRIIYLPKYSSYRVSTKEDGDVYCINFQIDEDREFKPETVTVNNSSGIVETYKRATGVWQEMRDGRQLKCKAELYNVMYEIARARNQPYHPSHRTDVLLPAETYIHKNYVDGVIKMTDLAEMCGMSYEYFRRLFNEKFGCSPVAYINGLKLQMVKELLESGDYSVTEAAEQAGFIDMAYFSRFFKKHLGVSPSRYKSNDGKRL